MHEFTVSWRFWLLWVLAFLGFPIGGLLASLISSVTSPLRAVIAGAVAGAVLGSFSGLYSGHDFHCCPLGGSSPPAPDLQ